MLHYAVWSGFYALVEELVTAGADPVLSCAGETALSLATELQDGKMLALLQSTADPTPSLMHPDTGQLIKLNNYMDSVEVTRKSVARW